MSAAGELVRETRVARSTGATVELIDSEHPDCDEFQSDEGGRWVTICRAHGAFVQHETWKLARTFLGHPEEWCDACREDAPAGGSNSKPGFSAEERARAAETRRRKAEERRKKREAEEKAKRQRDDLDRQWSDWTVGEPMIDRLYIGDERERQQMAREDAADARAKATSAKRALRAAEESIETVTRLKIKSKREKKNLQRLEGEASALDEQVVAEEDRARITAAEQTRLARVAFVRGALAGGWKLEADDGRWLVKGDRRVRFPDDYLDAEDFGRAAS